MKAILLTLVAAALADYSSKDSVVILTEKNFKSEVLESDDLWMVEFYAPWCGHCKSLEPAWKSAAKDAKDVAKFGAVDATVHTALASKYGVKGYPTIKVFGKDKKKPEDYNGGRAAKDLVAHATKAAKKLGKGGDAKKDDKADDKKEKKEKKENKKEKKEKKPEAASDHGYGADVVTLTSSNFDKTVKNNKQVVFVKFMAPWCGHCKAMVGDLTETATKLKGQAVVGVVDATEHSNLASKYDVKGYPTLVVFYPDGKSEKYNGQRKAPDMISFLTDKASEYAAPLEIPQITSSDQFDEVCRRAGKSLCVIALLPHLADGGKERRSKYIKMLNELGTRHRRYSYAWTAAGEQPALADALGITVFPSIVAVNFGKGKFGQYTHAFDESHLNTWLTKSMGANAKLPEGELPIKDVAAWKGEDYVPPVETD